MANTSLTEEDVMTRTLTSLLFLTLCFATPAFADSNRWAQGRLEALMTAGSEPGRVELSGYWLKDRRALFSAFSAGRVPTGKALFAAARFPNAAAAREVMGQIRQDDWRKGGKFKDLPRGLRGFRFLRPLSGGRSQVTVVRVKGTRLFRVELSLEARLLGKAKELLKIWLEGVEVAVETAALPSPNSVKRVKSSNHLWRVTNGTRGAMTVAIRAASNGKTYRWQVASGQTLLLKVRPGKNFVTVTSELPNVNPFIGQETQRKGRLSASRFYVE